MEITRLDRFLWFVYHENEQLRAISGTNHVSLTLLTFTELILNPSINLNLVQPKLLVCDQNL